MEEIPLVQRAEKKYADKGLTVIWIGHQDKVDKLTAYAQKNGIRDYLFDSDDSMSRKFGMTYGGGLVFINREAIVKARVPKGLSASSLEAELKKIL